MFILRDCDLLISGSLRHQAMAEANEEVPREWNSERDVVESANERLELVYRDGV
jgi:hypothetical protein